MDKAPIHVSGEVAAALDQLARTRNEDRDTLGELLLRENPAVRLALMASGGHAPAGPGQQDRARSRRALLELVHAHPGIHMSRLASLAGTSWLVAAQHLYALEQDNEVHLERHGRSRHAFPHGFPAERREPSMIFERNLANGILPALMQSPGQSLTDISRRVGLSMRVVRPQLAALVRLGYVQRTGGSYRTVYSLTGVGHHAIEPVIRLPPAKADPFRSTLVQDLKPASAPGRRGPGGKTLWRTGPRGQPTVLNP